jgi:Holliday junction resolvase RusA-like endonuclease
MAGTSPEVIRFTVPGNPVPKGRPRSRIITAKDGLQFVSNYTPEKTRSEEAVIRYHASEVMGNMPLMSGPLEIFIVVYKQIPAGWSKKKTAMAVAGQIYPTTRPDYDNYCKMQDSLNNVIWTDDALIVDAHIYKRYSDRPRLAVTVKQKKSGELNV